MGNCCSTPEASETEPLLSQQTTSEPMTAQATATTVVMSPSSPASGTSEMGNCCSTAEASETEPLLAQQTTSEPMTAQATATTVVTSPSSPASGMSGKSTMSKEYRIWHRKIMKINAVDYFIKNLSDFNELGICCINGDLETLQGMENIDPNCIIDDLFEIPPLLLAILFGHQSVAEFLIKKGADIHATYRQPWIQTAMRIALLTGSCGIVDLLLQKGYNINNEPAEKSLSKDAPGRAYLVDDAFKLKAAQSTKLRMIKMLNKAYGEQQTDEKLSDLKKSISYLALKQIVSNDEFEIIKYVIETFSVTWERMLDMAIDLDKIEVVKLLMEESKANAENNSWVLPSWKYAVARGRIDILNYMKSKGVHMENLLEELLMRAVLDNNLDGVKNYLEEGANPNIILPDTNAKTPLIRAVQDNLQEMVVLLLENGAKNIYCHENGTGPLYVAALNDDVECARILLGWKESEMLFHPNETCKPKFNLQEYSPLFECRSLEMLQLMVEYGADVNRVQSLDQQTILFMMVIRNKSEMVKFLVEEQKVKVNHKDCAGNTPLHQSVKYKRMVKYLIKHGADVESSSQDGFKPLHAAVADGTNKSTAIILKNGAKPNSPSMFGEVPLHLAAYMGSVKKVKLLLNHKAEINFVDAFGNSALHIASARGSDKVVKYLLSCKDINVNLCNNGGATSLHLAAYHGHEKIIKYLLDRDLDTSLLCDDRTAKQLCLNRGFCKVFPGSDQTVSDISATDLFDCLANISDIKGIGKCPRQKVIDDVVVFVKDLLQCVARKDWRFAGDVYLSGSFSENCKMKEPDEIDMILRLKFLSEHIQSTPVTGFDGFVNLSFDENAEKSLRVDDFVYNDIISPIKIRAMLIDYIEDILLSGEVTDVSNSVLYYFKSFYEDSPFKRVIDEHKAGCILNLMHRHGVLATCDVSVDIIPLFEVKGRVPNFTNVSKELLKKCHVVDFDEQGSRVIPSAIPNTMIDSVWRYSTSHLEKKVFKSISSVKRDVYTVSKMLLKQFENFEYEKELYSIPSYFLKTTFFNELLSVPNENDWLGEKRLIRLQNIFKNLTDGLEAFVINSFFIEGHQIYGIDKKEKTYIRTAKSIISFIDSSPDLECFNQDPRSLSLRLRDHFWRIEQE